MITFPLHIQPVRNKATLLVRWLIQDANNREVCVCHGETSDGAVHIARCLEYSWTTGGIVETYIIPVKDLIDA